MITLEKFKKQNTNGLGVPDARYINNYGNIPFESAHVLFVAELHSRCNLRVKISEFEKFLASSCNVIKSQVSESCYYYYNGVKYRFSNHIYPTGSMTTLDGSVVDFAADPILINSIKF